MAVIKVAKGGRNLTNALDYVDKKAELTSGKDCSDLKEQALKEMKETKDMYDKLDGRLYKHYIQSFAPGETTQEQAHRIGMEWADKNFKGHEVFIATHTDKGHIHNHFIVNSVNFENGKKFQCSRGELKQMKMANDKICEREGLSIPQPLQDKEFRSFNQNKYQLFKRIEHGENVKSYVLNTALAVENSISTARNRADFINNMKQQGYEVDWKDNHKHVTFQDQDGNKVRLTNLEKTFNEPKFSKGGLEHEFTIVKESSRATDRADTPNIDWGAVECDVGAKEDRLPEFSGNEISGAIQQAVRAITNRTDRAIKPTEDRNARIEADSNQFRQQQQAIKRKPKSRTIEHER